MTRFNPEFMDRFLAGLASEQEIIEAMADCIRAHEHYCVRGYYRRLAQTLIDAGYIDSNGNIL